MQTDGRAKELQGQAREQEDGGAMEVKVNFSRNKIYGMSVLPAVFNDQMSSWKEED